jgi:hypothetical protein
MKIVRAITATGGHIFGGSNLQRQKMAYILSLYRERHIPTTQLLRLRSIISVIL